MNPVAVATLVGADDELGGQVPIYSFLGGAEASPRMVREDRVRERSHR